MGTTLTRHVQTRDLDVEITQTEDGRFSICAFERSDGRLGESILLNVDGQRLLAIVDLVTQAMLEQLPAPLRDVAQRAVDLHDTGELGGGLAGELLAQDARRALGEQPHSPLGEALAAAVRPVRR